MVIVHDYHTGRPRRPEPGQVYDQRGGVPRVGRGRKKGVRLPPRLVEYRVNGFTGWYGWFQLERVAS